MDWMRRTRDAAILGAALAVPIGCGGPASTIDATGGASHGGTLEQLPNDAGYVEVVVEAAEGGKGKIVAYFTEDAGAAPLDPAPTSVSFTDEGGKSYPMTASADEAARFESEPVSMPIGDQPTGRLSANIGGEAVELVNRPR